MDNQIEGKISPTAIARYREQIEDLKDMLRKDGASVGDRTFIAFPPKVAKDLKISEFGTAVHRMGEIEYTAGWRENENPLVYVTQSNWIPHMAAEVANGTWMPDVRKLMAGVPAPIPLKVERYSLYLEPLERGLISLLNSLYGNVVLVNPSFSTLKAAKGKIFSVFLTDDSHYDELGSSLQELGYDINKVWEDDPSPQVCYLGSNEPVHWYPRGVTLVLNPYHSDVQSSSYIISEQDNDLYMMYSKQDRQVQSVLEFGFEGFVYSPPTVARAFGLGEKFWIKSKLDLRLKGVDTLTVHHAPWAIMGLPKYERRIVQGKEEMVSEDENYIYDIVGQGTYLSRRARFTNAGKPWCSMQTYGNVLITRFTCEPQQSRSCKNVVVREKDQIMQLQVYSMKSVSFSTGVHPNPASFSSQRQAILFRASVEGRIVIPGFPRGDMVRFPYEEVKGHITIWGRAMEGHWVCYPTPADFSQYRWAYALTSVSWNAFLSAEDSDQTYQSKRKMDPLSRMDQVLQQRTQGWDAMVDIETLQMCWEAVPSDQTMVRLCGSLRGAAHDGTYQKWISFYSPKLKFSGARGELPNISGRQTAEVYSWLELIRSARLEGDIVEVRRFGAFLSTSGYEVFEPNPGSLCVWKLTL